MIFYIAKKILFRVYKINMKIPNNFSLKKTLGFTLAAAAICTAASCGKTNSMTLPQDTFVHQNDTLTLKPDSAATTKDTLVLSADTIPVEILPEGTDAASVLKNAPSPKIKVCGKDTLVKIVVDVSQNVLYKYDDNGKPLKAYLVATGKPRTPTDKGLRVVIAVESYPYKSAPASTKRHKKPWDYGPKALILEKLDPETGRRFKTGEFIHGNNNPKSLGKYASLGCIRMDNEVIKQIAKDAKRGDLVLIQ